MGLGDALERLDRRVLGKHPWLVTPPKRPLLFRVGLMTAVVVVNVLLALKTGSTWADLTDPVFLFLVGVVIVTPFLVAYLRQRAKRLRSSGEEPPG